MIFSKGDKVKFLNEIGGGEVIEVIDDKMVMIETKDGFEMPYLISELIPEGNLRVEMEQESEPVPEPMPIIQANKNYNNQTVISKVDKDTKKENVEVFLALVNQEVDDKFGLNAFLINTGSYNFLFHLGIQSENGWKTLAFDELETDEKILLGSLPEISGDDMLRISYQFIFFKNETFQLIDPLKGVLNLDNKTILFPEAFVSNEFFNEKAVLFPLALENKIKLTGKQIRKESVIKGDIPVGDTRKPKTARQEKSGIEEVDLHADAIMEDPRNFNPAEIIEMQIARFEISLRGAINSKQKKIVFIHGAGSGKLKHRIRGILEEKYPKLKYQDASFKEYGYGATLVILPG